MSDSTYSDRPKLPAPVSPAETAQPPDGADDMLARLIRLVAVRARSAEGTKGNARESALQGFREAVSALEHHLEALALLEDAASRAAGAASNARPATEPPTATETPAALRRPAGEWEPGANADLPEPPVPASTHDYPPFRDQVTGLHSREGFDAVAGGELKRCRRYGRVFSLALFQLPGADPSTFRRAANAVAAATRESDLAGRHVDRTLAVALPETPPTEARLVAERIIRHFEGVGAWDEESRVGLVTHPAHGETLLHLVEAARVQLTRPARQVLAAPDERVWPG